MKNYILIALFLLSCAGVQAQITLTSSYNLNVGDTYRYDIYDEVNSLDLGTTGGGNSWDFSGISGTFISGVPVECVNPLGTPFADSAAVATANLCTKTAGSVDGAYVYYEQNSANQKLLGNGHYETGNVSFANYSDKLIGMEFPCTYGNTFSDNYDVKIYNVTAGGYLMRDSGTVYTDADAFGSMVTPAGTYNNVLRLTSTTTSFTWMNIGGEWMFTGMNTTINYNWFAEGIKAPVMAVTEFVGFSGYSTQYLAEYNFPLGIEEHKETCFDLYPNPAGEYLNIYCAEGISAWKIYGTNGQVLDKGTLDYGKQSYRLPVSHYPPGMYILEASMRHGLTERECFVKR